MPRMTCPNCGREHEYSVALAGLTLVCKGCSNRLPIPSPQAAPVPPNPHGNSDAAPAAVPARPSLPTTPSAERRPSVVPRVPASEPKPPQPPPTFSVPPVAAEAMPAWRRHLHWLLVLALLPLAWSLVQRPETKEDQVARLREALDRATPAERERFLQVLKSKQFTEDNVELLFDLLPDHKFAGALLGHDSKLHWVLAAGSAILFLALVRLLSTHGVAEPRHLLWVSLFTATAGIALLFLFQWTAEASQGVWLTGGNVVVILFYVVKFIGFSYRAALDPNNGFFLSFLGFTCGVGFCEEVVKALPLLWIYRRPCTQSWRGAFVWGLASGAAFGIAEGVLYAGTNYNGVRGPEIYLVRFLSCVALHGVWTGSVAITLHHRQETIQNLGRWYDYILPLLIIVAVPVVLHGLYDTLLKKEMNLFALGVALLSFGYLAYQIRLERAEDAELVVAR